MKFKKAKSIVFVETTITEKMVKRLEDVNPGALTLRDEKGNALFTANVGPTPSIGKYGIVVNAKKDIMKEFDKPVTDAMVKDWAEAFFARAVALEAQIALAAEAADAIVGAISIETLAE
jgi:hypothetical protein